jgi:hypothetical protein
MKEHLDLIPTLKQQEENKDKKYQLLTSSPLSVR